MSTASLLGTNTVNGPGPSRMEGSPQFCGSEKEAQGGSDSTPEAWLGPATLSLQGTPTRTKWKTVVMGPC